MGCDRLMTHLCWPHCRCGLLARPERTWLLVPNAVTHLNPARFKALGFRLFTFEDVPHPLPEAAVVSLRVPERGRA